MYWPAIVAIGDNPLRKACREFDRAKAQTQVMGSVMQKLLHLAQGI